MDIKIANHHCDVEHRDPNLEFPLKSPKKSSPGCLQTTAMADPANQYPTEGVEQCCRLQRALFMIIASSKLETAHSRLPAQAPNAVADGLHRGTCPTASKCRPYLRYPWPY